jgi:hypothetical protein
MLRRSVPTSSRCEAKEFTINAAVQNEVAQLTVSGLPASFHSVTSGLAVIRQEHSTYSPLLMICLFHLP